MEIPALKPHIAISQLPLEKLADNPHLSEPQKVAELTRQFEAVLLRQILQEAQKPVFPSRFTDNSAAAQIYRDMATAQWADAISKSGTMGLADALQTQLVRELAPAEDIASKISD
ncbi:MAG: rod-binding protein [Verrucomicrobiota bacterium]|jgi:peptidoglycan hydrolase FlgJ